MREFSILIIILILGFWETESVGQKYLNLYNEAQQMYDDGQYHKALQKYKDSYQSGDSIYSPLKIGYIYAEGVIGNKDLNEAENWFEISSKHGNFEAKNRLGECYLNTGKKIEAFNIFSELAEEGDIPGQYSLGMCYLFGTGTTINYKKSLRWINAAAIGGYGPAQWQMARAYFEGHKHPYNMDCNAEKFIKLTISAANQDVPEAQFHLALIYKDGFQNIEKNYSKAVMWLNRAAQNGYQPAFELIKSLRND